MAHEPTPKADLPRTETERLHSIIEVETNGRARNGRIAWVAVVTVFVVSLLAGVAIKGWSDTSSSLEQRNTAVEQLGNDLARLSDAGIQRDDIGSCARNALAVAFDDALVRDDYVEGRLLAFYQRCEETDGRTFRPAG